MDRAEVSWRMVVYGGTPHSFTNEAAGEVAIAGVAYDAIAEADSWITVLRFLADCGMGA